MKTFKELMEQMTPPKAPGKRDLLNLTPTEKKLDSLVRLSNRAGVRRALQTGKSVYPYSEGKVGSDRFLGALMRKVHSDAQTKYDTDKLKPQANLKKV